MNTDEHGSGQSKPQMDTDEHRSELGDITEKIIGCAFAVGNTLGPGFLEKVYENALAHEIRKAGLKVQQQQSLTVKYDDVVVGDFAADLLVDDRVLVELKAAKGLDDSHTAQCLNYLTATGLRICLLLNFGKPRVEVKRVIQGF